MKKFLLVIFIIFYGCGFKPLYSDKEFKNLEFSEITLSGNTSVNRKIINYLKISKKNGVLDTLTLNSNFENLISSKDSTGKADTYLSILKISLKIQSQDNILIYDRKFNKSFSYKNRDNKFELVEYQNEILNNLVNEITEEILLSLNSL
jgi:hypothetical protein